MNQTTTIGELIASIPVRLFNTEQSVVLVSVDGDVIATFSHGDRRAESMFRSFLTDEQWEALVIDAEIAAELDAECAAERRLSYGPGIH